MADSSSLAGSRLSYMAHENPSSSVTAQYYTLLCCVHLRSSSQKKKLVNFLYCTLTLAVYFA